jgi:predicted MFS family arabinose efflux permease
VSVARPPLGRRFLTVWLGQTVSTIGTVLSGVGVGVYVFVETGSAAWLGLLAAVSSVPYVLTAPLLSLADRFTRRSTMIAADTFAVVGPAIAFVLALGDRLEIWHLAVAGFLGGVGNAFQWPASQAAVPALVAPEALGRANGLNQLGQAAGIVLGPVVATPLVAWWGIEAVLLVDLVTFAVAVGATLSVRFDDVPVDGGVTDDGTWAALFSWLRGDGRPFVTLLAIAAVVNLLLAFFNVAILVLATDLGGTARAGFVLGAAGAAMVVGSIVCGRRGVGDDRIGTFARGIVLAGGGFVLASIRPSLTLLIVGVVVALGSVPALNAASATLYHERVPSSMHGRMFGLRTAIGRSLEPIGAVTAGLVVAHLATPAMSDGGALAGTVGAVIGVGSGRGAALILAVVGLLLGAIGVWLARSSVRGQLRPDPPASPDQADQLAAA